MHTTRQIKFQAAKTQGNSFEEANHINADSKAGEMKATFVNACFEGLNEYIKAVNVRESQIKPA